MSHLRSRLRSAATFSALLAGAALGVASPASAATGTVDLQCNIPLIGEKTVTVDFEYPSEAVVDRRVTFFRVTSVTPDPAITGLAPEVTFNGRLAGTFGPAENPSPSTFSFPFFFPTNLTPDGALYAFWRVGDWLLTPTGGKLTIRMFDDNGDPILQPEPEFPVETDDDDPATVQANCAVAPGTAPATIKVVPDVVIEPAPPSVPGPLEFEALTPTSARATWGPSSTDAGGPGLKGYEVTVNGGAAQSTQGTSLLLTGLSAATTYSVRVVAVDNSGWKSDARTGTFTTPSVPASLKFALTGNASLKTLVRGTVPLTGNLLLTGAPDAFAGSLALAPTTAQLRVLGTLPVKATIEFVPTTGVTGTATASTIALQTQARIKVKSALLFGSIPLVSGHNCQTRQPSTIKLGSANFGAAGGTLTGTFAISNLSGCGSLTGIVSAATAGNGNMIALKATPTSS